MATLLNHVRMTFSRSRSGMRVLVSILSLAVLLAGLPVGELHAHSVHPVEHGHAHDVAEGPGKLPAQGGEESPVVVHLHDATSTFHALPALLASAVIVLRAGPLRSPMVSTPLEMGVRSTPHRPPIA